MPRYDDRYGSTRLYVGHLSSRTRSHDLEDLFSRYGRTKYHSLRYLSHDGLTVSDNRFRRVRDVDLKHDFAFVEFSDPRDADDARYSLNGREFRGSRIIVEFAKGGPRGSGGSSGSREYLGRGPPPGSGRCFNCGLDGHWARDCKAGDWKNKCYRCGERGHIERNCQNSPKELRRERSYSRSPSRSPSPRRGRSQRRSYSRGHSYSRSRSPPRRERSVEHEDKRSRSPRYSTSPKPKKSSPPPSQGRNRSPTPDEKSPQERGSPPMRNRKQDTLHDGSDYSESPRAKSRSPMSPEMESPADRRYLSPPEVNGHSRSPSPRDDRTPDDDDDSHGSPRGSESPSSA